MVEGRAALMAESPEFKIGLYHWLMVWPWARHAVAQILIETHKPSSVTWDHACMARLCLGLEVVISCATMMPGTLPVFRRFCWIKWKCYLGRKEGETHVGLRYMFRSKTRYLQTSSQLTVLPSCYQASLPVDKMPWLFYWLVSVPFP